MDLIKTLRNRYYLSYSSIFQIKQYFDISIGLSDPIFACNSDVIESFLNICRNFLRPQDFYLYVRITEMYSISASLTDYALPCLFKDFECSFFNATLWNCKFHCTHNI